MNAVQQTNANRATGTKATVDQFGHISYKHYSIEFWTAHNTFSIYNMFNSMYDNADGFKSVEEAVQYIDTRRRA